MHFVIIDILDLIFNYLGLALILSIVFIIIVFLIIYKLMHTNLNNTKSEYRTQKIVLAQIQQKEEELMYGEQSKKESKKDAKVGRLNCKFCGGEIVDDNAAFCPLCGSRT